MSLKAFKRGLTIITFIVLVALMVLCVVLVNQPATLSENKFEIGTHTFSQGETMWDFWKENIGNENCSWSKYCEAVSELNGNVSLGDIRTNQTVYVYYLVESEIN